LSIKNNNKEQQQRTTTKNNNKEQQQLSSKHRTLTQPTRPLHAKSQQRRRISSQLTNYYTPRKALKLHFLYEKTHKAVA
jgi:hypothetical protein